LNACVIGVRNTISSIFHTEIEVLLAYVISLSALLKTKIPGGQLYTDVIPTRDGISGTLAWPHTVTGIFGDERQAVEFILTRALHKWTEPRSRTFFVLRVVGKLDAERGIGHAAGSTANGARLEASGIIVSTALGSSLS
jgi:hypothetical protein